MFSKFEMYYDRRADTLSIMKIKQNGKNLVSTEEGKYGITIRKDVEDVPRMITIPEVSVLFGIKPIDLELFCSIFR